MTRNIGIGVNLTNRDALIAVDVQIDFCSEGSLPVTGSDLIIPILNKYIQKFNRCNIPIFATRDWHPRNHISFKENGGIWPVHCIQMSSGASFHPGLHLPTNTHIVNKGTSENIDAYSGFEETNLKSSLRKQNIKRVFVGGLATDYCVKATVLDALTYGFSVIVLEDGSSGVDLNQGDSSTALDEMVRAGALTITIKDVL